MKISIITINLNNKEGLESTVRSVISQTYFDKVEYIIIDGGSTDGSVDVILDNERFFKYWVSEPDNGIYNAMNKGVKMASGDYCLFLNSGDHFHSDDAIERMYGHLDRDIVYGDLCIHQGNPSDGYFIKNYTDTIPDDYFIYEAVPHEAAFVRTDLLRRKGFREDYRIISDTIFFHESIVVDKASYRHVDCVVTDFYLGGVSSDMPRLLEEKERFFKIRIKG
jgi:glycosyltransferase involved in cell wall biosynthesis